MMNPAEQHMFDINIVIDWMLNHQLWDYDLWNAVMAFEVGWPNYPA
jgi:hypothetical protein